MLNIIAVLFVIFGLIGLFTIVVRHFHNSGLKRSPHPGVVIEQPIKIDRSRSILTINYKGIRHVILRGPHNDILLETNPAPLLHEAVSFESESELRIPRSLKEYV